MAVEKKFNGLKEGDVVWYNGKDYVLLMLLQDGWTRIATPRRPNASLRPYWLCHAEQWIDYGDPVYWKCLVPTERKYDGTFPPPQQ